MNHFQFVVLLGVSLAGCGGDVWHGTPGQLQPPWGSDDSGPAAPAAYDGASAVPDAGVLSGSDADVPQPDAIAPSPPKVLGRGLQWVRDNPMFISALTVRMGQPSPAAVDDYFNAFHANAVHLWTTGLPTEMDGWRKHAPPGARFFSWLPDDGVAFANNKVIGGYPAAWPGRIGYQIGDEPRTLAALQKLDVGVNAVRAADPDALIVINFSFLADNFDQLLDYCGSQMDVDVIKYDRYSPSSKSYETIEKLRAVGLKYGMPYWRYLRGYYDGHGLHPSDLRWDAFVGLVYGYTGHSWFLYQIKPPTGGLDVALFASPGSYAAAKTAHFATVAQLNTQLANLGRAITQLTSTDVRYIAAIGLARPGGTKAWSKGAGGDPYITDIEPLTGLFDPIDLVVGTFVDDAGERYVMVQNANHKNGSWPVDNDKSAKLRVGFDFAGAPATLDRTQLRALNKDSGQVETIALSADGGSAAHLDVTLAAGDVILFKYANGTPFALGK